MEAMDELLIAYLFKKVIIISAPLEKTVRFLKKQLRVLRDFARHFLRSQSRKDRKED